MYYKKTGQGPEPTGTSQIYAQLFNPLFSGVGRVGNRIFKHGVQWAMAHPVGRCA
jgi:hypothetical protein